MRFKAVIFDLDGTSLNTLEDLADSTNIVLRNCGYPEHRVILCLIQEELFACRLKVCRQRYNVLVDRQMIVGLYEFMMIIVKRQVYEGKAFRIYLNIGERIQKRAARFDEID